ncbi:Imm49 family immunity protein [Streptomyces sp. NPDC001584]|uniref:Imm49 family immunity protein n=1 Tax=Streptomyces sp. NPDC001584 TaxID=3154521 RepID=UPI00332F04F1
MICRENDRLKQLAQVPVEYLRAPGAEFDESAHAWIETLQNLWFGREETRNTLVTAVQGTAPGQPRIADDDLTLKILYPPLALFQLYLRREDHAFTDSLARAMAIRAARVGHVHAGGRHRHRDRVGHARPQRHPDHARHLPERAPPRRQERRRGHLHACPLQRKAEEDKARKAAKKG